MNVNLYFDCKYVSPFMCNIISWLGPYSFTLLKMSIIVTRKRTTLVLDIDLWETLLGGTMNQI